VAALPKAERVQEFVVDSLATFAECGNPGLTKQNCADAIQLIGQAIGDTSDFSVKVGDISRTFDFFDRDNDGLLTPKEGPAIATAAYGIVSPHVE
jgi:hypothetical protein